MSGAHFQKTKRELRGSSGAVTLRWRGDAALFTLFVFAVCSFGLCWVIDRYDLPGVEVLQMDRDRSNLEGKEYQTFPTFEMAAFNSTDFQDGVESFINDRMPLRDSILLLNASWQRTSIALSATLHGFATYPSFYGSSYAYDSAHDALYEILSPSSDATDEQYESAADAFSAFISRHGDKDFYFYRLDRLSSSSNNPTNELQSNVVNTEYLSEHFFNRLEGATIIDGLLDDQEESLDVFYRTDHHWNGVPAYQAYVHMLGIMRPGVSPVVDLKVVVYEEPEFLGSCARAALCVPEHADTINDYVFDMDGYEIVINGKEQGPQSLQHTLSYTEGTWDSDPFMNRYAEYWHGDFGWMSITNKEAQTDESLLIIRDSYGAPVERYFADCYQTVYEYDARHNEQTLDEFMADKDIDDVLVLMGSTNFASSAAMKSLE